MLNTDTSIAAYIAMTPAPHDWSSAGSHSAEKTATTNGATIIAPKASSRMPV